MGSLPKRVKKTKQHTDSEPIAYSESVAKRLTESLQRRKLLSRALEITFPTFYCLSLEVLGLNTYGLSFKVY